MGAVLVGAHDPDGPLKYCGVVGAGMTDAHRRTLTGQLMRLRGNESPLSDTAPRANWVRPLLIGDVEYRELRGTLRHASWKGLRADLSDAATVQLPAS